jgi:hypothetical protein
MTVACYPDYGQKGAPASKSFRRRNPSIEIQQETKALLEATLFKKLPRSLADTEGVMLTQKNTFFHVQPMRDCYVQTCCQVGQDGDDRDCCFYSPDKCVKVEDHAPFRGRKGTEVNIIVLQRRGRINGHPSSNRCQSCPPTAPSTPCARGILSNVCSITPPPGIARAAPPAPTLYTFAPPHSSTMSDPTPQPLPLMNLLNPAAAPITGPLPADAKTTVMLRNVPYHEGQVGVLRLLESRGFLGKFDFFYAPLDFNSGNNLGYAFINFKTVAATEDFFNIADGLRVGQEGWQQKELRVCWARVQGLQNNVEQYRNSPVNEMPIHFRPMLFDTDGGQLTFPRPDNSATQRQFYENRPGGPKSPPRRNSNAGTSRRPSFPSAPGSARKSTRVI